MNQSWLPAGGVNVFQRIKAQKVAAEANGVKIIDLSIGQPKGPALESARVECAKLALSIDQRMHEYQDNGVLLRPDFAQRFVQAHVRRDMRGIGGIDYMPIPGIKPMLPLVPIACDLNDHVGKRRGFKLAIVGMTNPGYGVPETWARNYLASACLYNALPTNQHNGFVPELESLDMLGCDLIMLNYPHNPSGQISSREWLESLCVYCQQTGKRIFNDAAYAILAGPDHCTLAEVAVDFPGLSWMEAYSSSKAGNFTGWRVGAVAGSPDFVGDLRTIKGNTDSGLFAPGAMAILHSFENDLDSIISVAVTYRRRIELLTDQLGRQGLRLAVDPRAGFFTLWQCPKRAFGEEIANAEAFNNLMIAKTGLLGVPFGNYIRYAVVDDIHSMISEIVDAIKAAKVEYD